ncbi:hypothetical protein TSUD_36660 [Trifolium subterraneum]|uniref:Integrase catalytic domain-containing protein n=1 Tax=Trifolium subterraneum TaxID=3900 RepID=A0A2Z6MFS8_TRISU|nr:hypothetical protein TSUD_36660 [Trifolium subterraneum]
MDSESSFSKVALPVFDGDNYDLWAVRMEAYLEALDIWEAVEEDYEVPPLPNNPTMAQIKIHKEKKTNKAKARLCLFAGVSETVFTRIMTLRTPKAIWDYLKEEYAGDERIRSMQVLNLMREFELQRMKESETIKEYSDKLLSIANKVRLLGTEFTDSRIVEKILVTVPERYEASLASLENTKDLSKITLSEVIHALQAHEQRRLTRQDHMVEGALPVKSKKSNTMKNHPSCSENGANNYNRGKGKRKSYPPCQHCGKSSHPPFKCWSRLDAKFSKCNEMGHEAVICRANIQQAAVEAENAQQEEEEDHLFVATCTEVKWVRIGNGEHIPVKGKGTIAITSYTGTKNLTDVLYVPEINQNLLSVGKLLEKGFKVIFEDKNCIIKDPIGQEMFKVKMKSKSFSFDPMKKERSAFPVTTSTTDLWHKRLGHFHYSGMDYMLKNQLVRGVPSLTEKAIECEACQFGKQTRKPFPTSSCRANQKLQLILTDVAGPQRTPSLNGSLYYIVFIDDFTRMCWIYFLRYKSEVAAVFWKFKAHVENQSNSHIQILRSDNGKEYLSNQFQQFCDEAGIEHQLTAPYTPQQNGVSERKNRSIMDMVKRGKLDKKAEPGIFIGYSTISKAYKIFQPQTGKNLVSRDVHFMENEKWSWSDPKNKNVALEFQDTIDDPPVRGTRLVSDIYQRSNIVVCNIAVFESSSFEEAATEEKWPDILFSVSLLSRFMHCASELHLKAAKRVIRYIKGTVHYGVKYCKVKDFKLFGYSDSDWAGSSDDMKSTSGYCFSIGSSVFSWCSKKQEVVAQSTAEAEFVAATAAANQAIWLRNILADLGLKQEQSTQIFVDNQAAISISYNPVFHGKTKHFNVKLFYLREVQGNGDINLVYCKTEDQAADIFTKPSPLSKFEFLRKKLGICSLQDKEEC